MDYEQGKEIYRNRKNFANHPDKKYPSLDIGKLSD